MESKSFCYWLQGLFELGDVKTLSEKQVDLIKAHLNMVFYHEIDQTYPEVQQEKLNELHEAGKATKSLDVKEQRYDVAMPYKPLWDSTRPDGSGSIIYRLYRC